MSARIFAFNSSFGRLSLRALPRLLPAGLLVLLACSGAARAALPIQHWTQPSGARVYLVESPAIPMVDVQIDFDAGSRRDPASRAGLAASMAAATSYGVRSAGKEAALDENALSDAWADLGASFGGSASADRLSFSLRSLTYPDLLRQAAQLASRQLGEPAFPAPLWARDRPKLIAALREANTRPATLAGRAFAQAVYGSHPYAQEQTIGTLQRIEVTDMKALHTQMLRACAAKVSLVGALSKEQADTLVSQLLSRLPAGPCAALPAVPEVAPLAAAHDDWLEFNSAQAHVLLGQPGIARSSPDYFAFLVANHILGGGGFTSRLTTEVREKRGLTYSVYSSFTPGLHAGAFVIGLQTRPDQAEQALQLVRQVLTQFAEDGPTEAELQAAKDNLVGGFALRLDSNRKLLDNVANIAWNDLPLDYLDHWGEQISRLTVEEVAAAFARIVHPERLVSVVLGARQTR